MKKERLLELAGITEGHGFGWDIGKMTADAKESKDKRLMQQTIDSIVSRFKDKEIDKETALKYLKNKELSDEEMKKAVSKLTEGEKEILTKVTIEINTTNDAFNVPEEEVSRILSKAASDVKRSLENKSLLDVNGNKVGSMRFTFSRK